MKYPSFLALFLLASVSPCFAAEPTETIDYQQHIVPVFRKYCVGCHDQDAAEGKLVMDSFAALMKGGSRGAAITPGDSKRSRLIRMMTGAAEPKMPPPDNQAPKAEEIELIARWIDAGAPGPKGTTVDPYQLVTPQIAGSSKLQPGVQAVDISLDGKLAAVGTYRTVRVVQLADGMITAALRDLAGEVNSVRYSKDGKLLIIASGEPGLFGEVVLWQTADGKVLKRLRCHKDSLYAAELSPDGRTLATAGYDREIKLWEAATGKELHTLKGHNDAVYGLAFNPQGTMLASASGDRTAKLWHVESGQRLETFPQSLKELYAVAFTPDGKHLLAGGVDSRLRVWKISETGQEGTNPILHSRFAHEGAILRITFSRDGQLLATSAEDRTVKLWTPQQYAERLLLEPQTDWSNALAFTPNGKTLLVGRHDGTLALYDPASGKKQSDFKPTQPKPELVAIAPRGGQAGQKVKLKVSGKNLDELKQLKFSGGKLAWQMLPESSATAAWLEVDVPKSVNRGAYDLSWETSGGASNAVKWYVDDLPQAEESEPNNLQTQAGEVQLPMSVWGVLSQQGDEDCFTFAAKKGQTLVLDLHAAQVGSKANALLTLFDASGRVLAANNDFDGQNDPLVAFVVPQDGKYTAKVRDLLVAGSAEHIYRLSIGTFPFVTGVYPLSMSAKQETSVELAGYNLPAGVKVSVKSGAGGMANVPLDAQQFRFRRSPSLVVGLWPELLEQEPNDKPAQATVLQVPCTVNGRFVHRQDTASAEATLQGADTSKPDVDLYRFTAAAGSSWIMETDAARRGSPVDTRIEVLHADGRPVERLLLQATRDSYITFRPIDSNTNDARVKNWEEMELNEFLYLQGEVCKIFRMPQGPDSGFRFYSAGGPRLCYFDSSPTVHALDEPCYIVQPHAPGTSLVPNGLPTFTVNYANDDSGDRQLGTDSRLTFTAPAAGDYVVRVTYTRNRTGDRFAYRLTIRPPQPDFKVTLAETNVTVGAGGGQKLTFKANRIDGFDGDIKVQVEGLPAGFHVSTPVVIQAGHFEAAASLTAAADAAAPKPEAVKNIKLTASASIAGQTITHAAGSIASLKVGPKPKVIVYLEPAEITIVPGKTVAAKLRVERNGFDDRISFDVENLPHGVIVDNIGLSGVLIREKETERTIFLKASSWVPATTHPITAVTRGIGVLTSAPVTLHVRPESPLANAAGK